MLSHTDVGSLILLSGVIIMIVRANRLAKKDRNSNKNGGSWDEH
jgi:hypothetical protein